jgi:hypothetical protein
MVNFQRMRDELDGLGTQVSSKLPPISKRACAAIFASVVALIVLFGLAICFGARGGGAGVNDLNELPSAQAHAGNPGTPRFIWISNNSQSCPPLKCV